MRFRKRLKRYFRYNRKKSFMYTFLFLLLCSLTIGYAVLQTDLNITGSGNISKATWDIHFENIQINDGSVEAVTAPNIDSPTEVSFSVKLYKPGDFYRFTVDVVNSGTIDGVIDSIKVLPELSNSEKEYLKYSLKYSNGSSVELEDGLKAGSKKTLLIEFEYLENEDHDKYPEEAKQFPITIEINYSQGVVHTLYDVLMTEATNGGLAKKYTGEHHDSFTEEPSKDIYHWYAKNNTEGTAILDKNNVIFANHCWQMIRTTDTGGVKMIYNGEVENNQCLNTRGTHVGYGWGFSDNLSSNYWYGTDYTYDSTAKTFKVSGTTEQTTWNATTGPGLIGKYTCKSTSLDGTCTTLYLVESFNSNTNAYVIPLNSSSYYSQFGKLQFNANFNSPAYVGYMYNSIYPTDAKTMTSTESVLWATSINQKYWYADSISWDSATNKYSLVNPNQVISSSDYSSLVGKYTFLNTNESYSYSIVYYIAAVDNSKMYLIQFINTSDSTHNLNYYNYTYTYGDSYTDNGDGTYTINNPTTIERKDWYTGYSNVGAGKYLCKNAVNDTCREFWYTASVNGENMKYLKAANTYKYGNNFTYENGIYKLSDDSVSFWNIYDEENKDSLNTHHYTCWNKTGECTAISYIYYYTLNLGSFYIKLSNGKNIGDALNEMFYNDNVNSVNSTIKTGVDAWYKHYLLEDYDDYIEDTIYCNDRSQSNADKNGFNPNGGIMNTYLQFNGSDGLSCSNDTDKFSVSNNKARLTYKIGLATYPEMSLLNNKKILQTGNYYWTGSPWGLDFLQPYVFSLSSNGNIEDDSVGLAYGTRPAISLKAGTDYISGDGSMEKPYVVK